MARNYIPPKGNLITATLSSNISGFLFFLLLFLLCFLNFGTKVTADPLSYDCQNRSTYSPNSTYFSNLHVLFSVLSSNATTNGFYNFTAGGRNSSDDLVYGLFLCRGDVSADVCRGCVANATEDIVRLCPNDGVAIVWYDYCLLRYSDQDIFSYPDQSLSIQLPDTNNITDPNRFMTLLGETMDDVATRAINGGSGKKFAAEEASFTAVQTLYCLGQCTPDLSGAGCDSCLRDAISSLPNCCNGKQGGTVLFPSCYVRFEVYPFYNITAVAPPPAPVSRGKGRVSSHVLIAIVVPIVVFALILVTGFCFLSKKAKKKYGALQEDTMADEITKAESLQFDLITIKSATKNFSDDCKIGEGGFGVVYKGTLSNGQEIAVKRLSQNSGQGAEEFKNEAVLVAKLQHRNLVRVLGFCLEREEQILIYEFMPNKSLDYFLFDPDKQEKLDWLRRYKIIRGIARGLLYLHEDSLLKIIHRDLKTSNILLDEDMNAKISDFGMARIFGSDQTHGNTSKVVGTYGYISPEYAMHGQFSVKSDVYSFGVLILEIVSGKKNSSFYQSDHGENLTSYAWKVWRDGTPVELMDRALQEGSYSRNEVTRCIHIGLLCVQEDLEARPSMDAVVAMLNSYSVSLSIPQLPAFFTRRRASSHTPEEVLESDQSTSKSIAWSQNEASITELNPR